MREVQPDLPRDIESVRQMISRAIEIIEEQRSRLKVVGKLVSLPVEGKALVIGDLHGDLTSMKRILEDADLSGAEAEEGHTYTVFLGDYIDRGPNQIEVMCKLLKLLGNRPNTVIPLRGNHEGPGDIQVSPHDFPTRLYRRYGEEGLSLCDSFRKLFNQLYTAVLVEGKALLLHGGIPTEAEGLLDIAYAHEKHPEKSHLTEILWNDPSTLPGVNYSFRGIGKTFGVDVASSFLRKIGVQMLVRGHEPCDEGYCFHDERVLTLFSCKLPHYGNNHASYLLAPLNGEFDSFGLRKSIHQI